MNSRTIVAFLAALATIICAYVQTPDPHTHRWIVTGDFYGVPFDPAFSFHRPATHLATNGCNKPLAPVAVESRLDELAHRGASAAIRIAEQQLPDNTLNSLQVLMHAANLLKQFDFDGLNRQPSHRRLTA